MTIEQSISSRDDGARRFRLYAISFALAVLSFAPAIIAVFRGETAAYADTMDVVGRRFGDALGRLLVAFGAGWLFFRITRRSILVGNALFCVILGVTTLAAFAAQLHSLSTNRAVLRDLREHSRNIAEKNLAALDAEEGTTADLTTLRQSILKLESAARTASGITRTAAQCSLQMLRTRERPMVDWSKALQDFNENSPFDVSTIKQKNDIQDRRAVVAVFGKANDEFARSLSNSPGIFERCLSDLGVSDNDRRDIMRGYQERSNLASLLAIRDCDREYVEAVSAYLSLLDEQ